MRDPKVFLRKGKTETAAASIIWIVGSVNNVFQGRDRILSPSRVVDQLGVRSSPSGRAEPFVRAAGFRYSWGSFHLDATYLVSARRRSIMAERDRNSQSRSIPCARCPFIEEWEHHDLVRHG